MEDTKDMELDLNHNQRYKVSYEKVKGTTPYRQYLYVSDFGVVWRNVIFFTGGHTLWVISLYYAFTCNPLTTLWNAFLSVYVGLGVTAGAHRLWAHRSYKAKFPLRLFLAIGQCIAGQNCIYIWCRDHRVHHKFSDTDADPHNILRGTFFSHVGWLLRKKHPDVIEQGNKIPLQDLLDDPIIYWQMVFYYPIYVAFAFFLPVMVPVYFWSEQLISSFFVSYIHRQIFTLHGTWFVNSAAHLWGSKPYDSRIHPVENAMVSAFSMGEGFHNYHHTFPYDYKTSELSSIPNGSRHFIELMAKWGQAYDLKTASIVSVTSMLEKGKNLSKKVG